MDSEVFQAVSGRFRQPFQEAPDGKPFVVCELDKLTPGLNWASVMEPQAEATADYGQATVELPELLEEEQQFVEETLQHLRRTHRSLRPVEGAKRDEDLKAMK